MGSFAQTIMVLDKANESPLFGVSIISERPKASAVTNMNGQADFTPFKNADEVEFRSLGFANLELTIEEIERMNYTVYMTAANFNLDEVIISATRWRENTANVPAKITSITPEQVALQNPQTAADLLGVSGKVFIQKSQQGGGSPMIRGFATNRLIYAVDGVRMNTAIFRGGNIQNVINLDPFATESTEVLFGPGSVIYGSDAIGGVMSFQTLTPELSLNDEVNINGKAVTRFASANNERTAHLDVNVGWKKFAMVTSFSTWNYDHLRQGRVGPAEYVKPYYVQRQDSVDQVIYQDDPLLQVPSAYRQTNLMQKFRFKPNANWNIQYGFHFSETTPYGRYDRHNRVRNGAPRYAQWDYGPQQWMMNNLSITHSMESGIYDQLSLRLAQQSFEESRIDRDLNKVTQSTQVEQVEAYSANLDLVKSIGARNTLFYGAEFLLNDVASSGFTRDITSGTTRPGPSRYPQSTWTSMAVYLNDEFRVTERITAQAGVRYNQFILNADFSDNLPYYPFPFSSAEINNGALTGSAGMVYRPSDTWVIKVNAGTAFRSPNVDDIGKVFDSEPGAVVVPNPDLQAEYAYNADLGIAKVFGDFLKVDVTGYYTLLENALVRRDAQLNGQDSVLYSGLLSQVQTLQNAAEARVYGVQAGMELKLLDGFSMSIDANYQLGEEELDDGTVSPSRHAAPFFGVARLNYKHKKLHLQFYSDYQAERSFDELAVSEQSKDEIYAKDEQGRNYAPQWYTLNVKARYVINNTFSISSGVENITDQRYRPYSSGISGPGRNFIIALRADF
jgi:hemoglobin/transferrin/lactoferrin receptor protein